MPVYSGNNLAPGSIVVNKNNLRQGVGSVPVPQKVMRRKRIGDLLIAEKAITEAQLMEALEQQKSSKSQKLGTVLIDLGFTTEEEIVTVLQKQLGIKTVSLSRIRIPDEIVRLVQDSSLLKKYIMMPFEFDEYDSGCIHVAMSDPLDMYAMDDLAAVTGLQVIPFIGTNAEILAAIDKYYGAAENKAVAEEYSRQREEEYGHLDDEEIENADVETAPMVILVKKMIEQAARQRASDIHIEPLMDRVRVRNRIDGVLAEVGSYPLNMLNAIITRVKIIGGMDIAEKRQPQDGRATQIVDRTEYDIRISTLPTTFGEKCVMRLTSKVALTRDKKLLGFSESDLRKFDQLLSNPYGIILATGPTGSGKSTTLYTALSELNKEDVNILTVEDPVEANIDGINQVQVNPKAGLTFASALRSFLRQDPDIIMVGEIRDSETAAIAVQASITGHLVVSTVHTNSAASTVGRLVDMGVEPYLLADALVGVIAQRLVRRLCTCCKKRLAQREEKRLLGITDDQEVSINEPYGCSQCGDTGYRGRIGVYEIMPTSRAIREAIASTVPKEELEMVAIGEGMSTLRMSTARLVLEGVTSMDEMRRIIYASD